MAARRPDRERGTRAPRGTWEPEFASGQGRGRTADTTIFSRVLYQLSYLTAMVAPRSGVPRVEVRRPVDRRCGSTGRCALRT
jgi:hypothetical protein